MYQLAFIMIVAAFAGMLFLNVYFRVKVLRRYKYLVQNEVNFTTTHFFNPGKMEEEVIRKHPQHKEQILEFVSLVKRSMTMASILILIIIAFGFLLLRSR